MSKEPQLEQGVHSRNAHDVQQDELQDSPSCKGPPNLWEGWSMYKSFLNRMHQRAEHKSREEQQAMAGNHNENDAQSRLFGRPAVYYGHAAGQYTQRHRVRPGAMPPPRQPTSRSGNVGLSVFVDPQFGGSPAVAAQEACVNTSQLSSWSQLASAANKTKENAQHPSRWSDTKIGQEARGQHGSRPDLNILVDDDFAEHSANFKGSFLDFPEEFRASSTQGSNQYLSQSSRNVSVQDAATQKSYPEIVSGYDTSLLKFPAEEGGSEAIVTEFSSPSLPRRTSADIQNTTKRPKLGPTAQETSEIEHSLEDEAWREPATTGADYGDMGSNGPVLSADVSAQSVKVQA